MDARRLDPSRFPFREMLSRIDCGPVAAMQALEYAGRPVERESFLRLWRYEPHVDCTDTPGHHLRAMHRLGLGVKIHMARGVSAEDLRRACSAGFPVVLLIAIRPMMWHWVALAGFEGDCAVVSWGRPERDGSAPSVRRLSMDELDRTRRPTPLCRLLLLDRLAYVIRPAGEGWPAPPWTTPPAFASFHRYLAAFAERPFLEPLLRGVGYAGARMTRRVDPAAPLT